MVQVEGVSLLTRQIEVLRIKGLNNIVVVGGFRADMLPLEGIKLLINKRYAETNMVWSLFSAEDELNEDVVVAYGDIVYPPNILQSLLSTNADIAVAVDSEWEVYWRARNSDPLLDAETLKLTDDGHIAELGRKPKSLEEVQGQYMGLMKFTSLGLRALKEVFRGACEGASLQGKSPEKAYMTDMLQALIDHNYQVRASITQNGWIEFDTDKDYENAPFWMRSGELNTVLGVET